LTHTVRGAALLLTLSVAAHAACPTTHDALRAAIRSSVKPSGGPSNGGLDNNSWAVVVDRTGQLCAIAFSGDKPDDQWPGSRVIAASKASTANAFSLKSFALSTANLYAGAQPGGFLYGTTVSSPPNQDVIYAGPADRYGSDQDPMMNKTPGGVIVFGGGLALYNGQDIVGALGVSGDTSCADHNAAWRVRQTLKLDKVPAGANSVTKNDGVIYDIGPNGKSASGYGHPLCGGKEAEVAVQLQSGSRPK